MKPLIGITGSARNEHKVISIYYDEYEHVPSDYVDAVRRAGGVPLMLPPGDDWQAVLPRLDAVIISGGADVSPACYDGNTAHPTLTILTPQRDSAEITLARHLAHESDLPALFICRGMQVLNVALGGTLHEHLPDVLDDDIHRNQAGSWNVHAVDVAAGSKLAAAMQAQRVETYSGHHQGVKTVGTGLEVTATAPDGVIEALELPGRANLWAVQWHPEKSAQADRTQQRLFDGLVAAALG